MSTLDSLFQRLGRCYRSREYCENIPNVKIYIKDTSGVGYIYDEEIYEKSIEMLRPYNGKILQEKVKIDLVDKLYSKEMLQGTEFYKKFNVDYNSFLELGSILSFFCSLKVNLAPQILRYIILKYSKATSLLRLSREAFQKEIDKFSDNIHDYLYCVRPSYVYPFIEYNGIVNLPYLIVFQEL